MPEEKKEVKEKVILEHLEQMDDENDSSDIIPNLPTSLNEELSEKIKDNPNKFIGCGG